MSVISTPAAKTLLRNAAASFCLVAIGMLAFASKGGGKKNAAAGEFRKDFTPIHSTSPFTLKHMPAYSGSASFMTRERNENKLSISSMITYQKGNTTFILPYRYKVNVPAQPDKSSNLQFLGVRIQMPR